MTNWNLLPQEIERLSWEIIEAEAPPHAWPPQAWRIVRRMIHTTADFEWVTSVRMHPRAIESGLAAIRAGAIIFTDTRMAQAGISPRRLTPFGGQVRCLMDDSRVASLATERGTTRAVAAVEHFTPEAIVVYAHTDRFQLLSDDGSRRVQVAGEDDCLPGEFRDGWTENKFLKDVAKRTFRSLWLEPR
jgi:precorrin isomerase